jgi:hypothetical protein
LCLQKIGTTESILFADVVTEFFGLFVLLGYEPFFGKHYRPHAQALQVEFLQGPLIDLILPKKKKLYD